MERLRIQKKASQNGYSLIEMLIYVSILSLFLVSVVDMTMSIARSYRSIRSLRAIESAATGSFERITRDVRAAQSVSIASSSFSVHPGVLVLIQGSTTTEFSLQNKILKVRENGGTALPLTSAEVGVSRLVFYATSSAFSTIVRIEMDIESGTSTAYRQKSFFDSVVTRGSF